MFVARLTLVGSGFIAGDEPAPDRLGRCGLLELRSVTDEFSDVLLSLVELPRRRSLDQVDALFGLEHAVRFSSVDFPWAAMRVDRPARAGDRPDLVLKCLTFLTRFAHDSSLPLH